MTNTALAAILLASLASGILFAFLNSRRTRRRRP